MQTAILRAENNSVSTMNIAQFWVFLAIHVRISLNLAGTITIYQHTYLKDSYAAVHIPAITIEDTVFLPLEQWEYSIYHGCDAICI